MHPTPVLLRCLAGLALAAGLQVAGAQAAAPAPQGSVAPPASGRLFNLPPSLVSGRSPFAPGCSGVPATSEEGGGFFSYAHAEASPGIVANPHNPLNLVGVWEQDKSGAWGSDGIGLAASFDGGLTWRRSFPPVTRCSGGTAAKVTAFERTRHAHVAFSPNGVAHYITHSFNVSQQTDLQDAVMVGRSTDGGLSWNPPVPLARELGQVGAVSIDMSRIAADPADARYVYATWYYPIPPDQWESGKVASPVIVAARSADNGVTWESGPFIDLGTDLFAFSNELKVLPDGTVVFFAMGVDSEFNPLAYVSRSTDRGLTWSRPTKAVDRLPIYVDGTEGELHDRVHSPVEAASVAVDPRNGTLYAAWEDGRFSGMTASGIALSQSVDGGRTWSEPVRVNRESTAWAFMPTVHVRFDGQVAVSYYDLRSNTADPATLLADLWLARSRDALNWHESRISGPFDMAKAPKSGDGLPTLGDHSGLASIGPFHVPFHARPTRSADLTDRTDILSQLGLAWGGSGLLAEAAQTPAALAGRLDREDEALPAYNVQGTRRPMSAVPGPWRQRAAKAGRSMFERKQMAEHARRLRIPLRKDKPQR